jgi:hypothetical protein
MRGFSVPSSFSQWAGLAGLAIVVLATLGFRGMWPSWVIPALGAFIGFAKIGDQKGFLIAGLALIATKFGLIHLPFFGHLVQSFTNNLILLVTPAMLVVAFRSIYQELK